MHAVDVQPFATPYESILLEDLNDSVRHPIVSLGQKETSRTIANMSHATKFRVARRQRGRCEIDAVARSEPVPAN